MSACSRCGCRQPNPTCCVCAEAEPFSEGESAYYAGEPKSANPYTGNDGDDWNEGWEHGEFAAQSDPVKPSEIIAEFQHATGFKFNDVDVVVVARSEADLKRFFEGENFADMKIQKVEITKK